MILRSLALAGLALALDMSVAMASTGPVTAEQAAALAQADRLLERQDWPQACTLIERHFGASPDNLQALARLGECRAGLGQYGRAMVDYQRILAEVDAPVIAARLRFLEAAAAQGLIEIETVPIGLLPPIVSGEATLGVLIDSNANAGTSATSVQAMMGAFPLLLAINPNSQGKPDTAATMGVRGTVIQPLTGEWALLLGGEARASLYTVDAANSTQSLRAVAGIIHARGPLSLNLQGNAGLKWSNGQLEQTVLGVEARGSFEVAPGLSLGLGGSLSRYDIPGDALRNNVTRGLVAGLQYDIAPGLSAGLDYVVTRVDATSGLYSYWAHGPRLGATLALNDALDLGVSYSYEMATYDQSLAMFPQGREDRRHVLGAALTLDLSEGVGKGASASLGYTFSSTDSSIDLHDVRRHAVTAELRYAF